MTIPTFETQVANEEYQLMPIGGEWREGGTKEFLENLNPYSSEVISRISQADRNDVDVAYAAAIEAQKTWQDTAPIERAKVIKEFARVVESRREEIAAWLVRESGSTSLKANIEIVAILREVELAAQFPFQLQGEIHPSNTAGKENFVYRKPVGVVTVISPWNFPMELSVRSVIPALALGNAVVLKPASDTPITGGLLVARLLEEAGLPNGLLSVLVGSGREIGDYLVEHPSAGFISFTGSTEIGKRVGALASGGKHIKPVALELGGNAPFVVLEDADVSRAARAAAFGRFLHQGQICMSTNRIIVVDAVYDEFVTQFVEVVRNLSVGNPQEPRTLVGPVVSESQKRTILEKIETARTEGARQLLGGEPQGLLIPPHVFVDVHPNMALAQEETFGPVIPIIRASDSEEALSIANDTEFGLSGSVFTEDILKGMDFARRIQAGMVHVNDTTVQGEPHLPFGGEKNSGVGRFNSRWIVESFTTTQLLTVQRTPKEYPL